MINSTVEYLVYIENAVGSNPASSITMQKIRMKQPPHTNLELVKKFCLARYYKGVARYHTFVQTDLGKVTVFLVNNLLVFPLEIFILYKVVQLL